ncbi:MAG TPA: polysaccharide deacetylase family protein [Caulobacteraceae bacterium]|nr:polysaccharide deacetylase family protein [Caulobacteraceae bacterium]
MTRARLPALVAAGVALIALAAAAVGLWLKQANAFYSFEGVEGPPGRSVIVRPPAAAISDYDRGGPHRLAVLVTDTSSNWLGLARAFKAEGVPFTITQDYRRALAHKVVLVYPIVSGRTLPPDALRGLAEHVRGGGAVLGFDLEGGGLGPVFGVANAVPSRSRETLRWEGSAGPPEEQTTRFSRSGTEAELGSIAYQTTDARVLARYDDGGAAVTCRTEGGQACLMGVDLGAVATRAIDGRDEAVARAYVNRYEPSLDVLVRWVSDFYVANEPEPWLVDTVPPGREVSIVLTHDIDYTRSVVNSAAYAELERASGIKATYFMQTKYIRDYNDDVFLTRRTAPLVRALQDGGMEVASHTVAHARAFKDFPLGDGREAYPGYRPFVDTPTTASGGDLFGETRVSKFLLERLAGIRVTSFRPGHLSYPFQLPEVLQATGYAWSSSVTADSCLTHLPHQMTFSRAGAALVPLYEFPVTIEDEEKPRLGDRFQMESDVIARIAARHGLVVILIHPDVLDHKLAFERELIAAWKDRAWMPDLDEFGAWWRARDRADFDLIDGPAGPSLEVDAPEALQNVTVMLPKAAGAVSGPGYSLAAGALTIRNAAGQLSIPLRGGH